MKDNKQPTDKKKQIKELLTVAGIIIAVALVIFSVIKIKNGNEVKHPNESGLVYTSQPVFFYATGAAKVIVLNELSYPKNSEFEDEDDFTVKYDKATAQYTVMGDVYASNGFGVKQKMFFTVVLTLGDLDKDNYSYRKVSCEIA